MESQKTIADPHSHYGDAKASTRHFIVQRLTGACNLVLFGFFIWVVIRIAGTDRAEMIGVIAHPFVAIVLALMIVSACVHMRIGMQEVIEDYVTDERLNSLSTTLNTFFSLAVGLVALAALIKIVFWG